MGALKLKYYSDLRVLDDTPNFFEHPLDKKGTAKIFRLNTYTYGFQGQEKDDEIKGEGNSVNYKYRMHDPRIGRFFSVDPLAPEYPHYSPYSFSGNRLIDAVEIEGLEPGVLFDSRDAAAENWAMFYGGNSFGADREYSSAIIKVETEDGIKYKYTERMVGLNDKVQFDSSVKNGTADGFIHSHPYIPPSKYHIATIAKLNKNLKEGEEPYYVDYSGYYNSEDFSGTPGKITLDDNGIEIISDDISASECYNTTIYLLTPGGVLKMYNPDDNKTTIVKTSNELPSDMDKPITGVKSYLKWDDFYTESNLRAMGAGNTVQQILDYNGVKSITEFKKGQLIKIPHLKSTKEKAHVPSFEGNK